MIIFILPQQGDPPTDVILIKDEDDIEGCGAVAGENMICICLTLNAASRDISHEAIL